MEYIFKLGVYVNYVLIYIHVVKYEVLNTFNSLLWGLHSPPPSFLRAFFLSLRAPAILEALASQSLPLFLEHFSPYNLDSEQQLKNRFL